MSSEFEKKIENLFLSNEKILSLQEFNSLIKESFVNNILLSEQQNGFDTTAFLNYAPKIPLAEKVIGLKDGSTDKVAQQQFMTILNKIVGSSGDLKSKLDAIANFVNQPKAVGTLSEILNNIMFVRILQTLMFDYQGGTAGNLHEAFVAAIIGGKTGDNKTIDDVMEISSTGESKISLKLLRSDAPVQGSINLLFNRFKEANSPPLIYYVGFKDYSAVEGPSSKKSALTYYKIVIKRDEIDLYTNLNDIFELSDGKRHTLEDYIEQYKKIKDSGRKLKSNSFILKKKFFKKSPNTEVISLNITRESLIKYIEANQNKLAGDVENLFKNLFFLSQNINKFYYSNDKSTASSAVEAKDNSVKITEILSRASRDE